MICYDIKKEKTLTQIDYFLLCEPITTIKVQRSRIKDLVLSKETVSTKSTRMVNEQRKFGEIYELHRNQSRGFAMEWNWIIRLGSKIVVGKAKEDEDSFVSVEKS